MCKKNINQNQKQVLREKKRNIGKTGSLGVVVRRIHCSYSHLN